MVMVREESDRGRESDSDSEILRFVYDCPPSQMRHARHGVRGFERTMIRKEWWKEVI